MSFQIWKREKSRPHSKLSFQRTKNEKWFSLTGQVIGRSPWIYLSWSNMHYAIYLRHLTIPFWLALALFLSRIHRTNSPTTLKKYLKPLLAHRQVSVTVLFFPYNEQLNCETFAFSFEIYVFRSRIEIGSFGDIVERAPPLEFSQKLPHVGFVKSELNLKQKKPIAEES